MCLCGSGLVWMCMSVRETCPNCVAFLLPPTAPLPCPAQQVDLARTFTGYGLDLCLCDVDTVWIIGALPHRPAGQAASLPACLPAACACSMHLPSRPPTPMLLLPLRHRIDLLAEVQTGADLKFIICWFASKRPPTAESTAPGTHTALTSLNVSVFLQPPRCLPQTPPITLSATPMPTSWPAQTTCTPQTPRATTAWTSQKQSIAP